MNTTTIKWGYWISTALFSLMMLGSATMYLVKYDDVSAVFTTLQFPTFIIYPLAIAKILGVIAIWGNFSKSLKEWAYAGFFFDLVLAFGAHYNIQDGDHMPAIAGLVLMLVSYFLDKKK